MWVLNFYIHISSLEIFTRYIFFFFKKQKNLAAGNLYQDRNSRVYIGSIAAGSSAAVGVQVSLIGTRMFAKCWGLT